MIALRHTITESRGMVKVNEKVKQTKEEVT